MTKEEFWNWFENNKTALENLISGKNQDYEIYEALSERLKRYNESLIPEITINEENKFILIISCDGVKKGIPFAESLTENLRQFDNWLIQKFRQPGGMEIIPLNGLNLKRSSIFLEWREMSSKKYFITFYVKGFTPYNVDYEIATLLHMDHSIGEYNAMTRIENVEIKKLGLFQSRKNLKTLDDLKIELENKSA